MSKEEDMSNTFVAEVGQKSAIFNQEEEVESLEEPKENSFPEVKIDPPTEMPTILEEGKKSESQHEEKIDSEEEFLEAKKKKKNKKYKKRNPFVTFLLMIICLALGAGASYYYFEVYSKTATKQNDDKEVVKKVEETEKQEEIKPSSIFVKKLIEKYDSIESQYKLKNYMELYSKEKTIVSDLDDEYVQKIGVANIRNNSYFTTEELNNSLNELFGKDKFKASEKDIEIDCNTYKYSDNSYSLKMIDACGGMAKYTMARKIVKAEKNKDKLYVNVAISLTDGNKIYKTYDGEEGTEEITDYTYQTFDIEKNYDKLNQYKYTFNYDEENYSYYLESIELIK